MIYIGIIPKEQSNNARQYAERLGEALNKANIREVHREKETLAAMADPQVLISDEQWCKLLIKVRSVTPEFKAEYLLDDKAQETVSKLDWTQEDEKVIEIFKKALATDALVLELPVSGGDDDES
jgi:hypothetical protein